MGDYCIKGSTTTIQPSRFMSSIIFLQWIEYLDGSIYLSTKINLILIFDICDFNFNDDIIKKYIKTNIILVLIP